VLGNFDEARPFVYSASSVGASFQPMTPCGQGTPSSETDPWSRLPDKSSGRPNGLSRNSKRPGDVMQGIFDKFDVSESGVKNKCVLLAGQIKQERESPTVGVEGTKHIRPVEGAVKPVAVQKESDWGSKPVIVKKEPELGGKPVIVKKERTGKEPSKGVWSSKGIEKSSHHASVGADAKNCMSVLSGDTTKLRTSNDVGSVKPSDDQHGHEHSEPRVALPAMSVTPKRFQSPKRLPQSSLSSQGLTPKKTAKLHNGVVVNGVSKHDRDGIGADDSNTNTNTKLKSLKLKITNPSKVSCLF